MGDGETMNADEAASKAGETEPAVELEAARREAKDNWERFLRARAEMENYQRRTEREVQRVVRLGKQSLFLRLLEVLDNLERALGAGEKAESLAAGVEMTRRQFCAVLEAEGIVAMRSEGETFDPARHEVLQVEEDPGLTGDEKVTAEFQKGYTWGEEVLRPARVKVARPPG